MEHCCTPSCYCGGIILGKPKQEITRLFNLHHATKIDAVQLAAKALGKELSLVMV
ncbi:transcriptional regulator [Escherichia coli]|nr:transcriptional regulator [Escherichia coli]PDS16127.1 transcriptional regulator [Escherichia coli]